MADTEATKPNENIEDTLDFGKKKKKKNKVKDLLKEEEEAAAAAAAAAAVPVAVESVNLEVETKKLEDLSLNQPADAKTTEASAEEVPDFLNTKKKPKRAVTFLEEQTGNVEFEPTTDLPKKEDNQIQLSDSQGDWQGSERDYTYEELLQRVFNIMKEKNPDMLVTSGRKKFVMRPPQVARVGTKKTSFTNFGDICRLLRRQEKHLLNFLLAELGTSGSTDINSQLIIKGRFSQKQIENVLRRYIKEYVTCHTCHSPETNLVKEERIFFLQCDTCGSKCAVASIKSGFQAQVVKRAAQRAKAT